MEKNPFKASTTKAPTTPHIPVFHLEQRNLRTYRRSDSHPGCDTDSTTSVNKQAPGAPTGLLGVRFQAAAGKIGKARMMTILEARSGTNSHNHNWIAQNRTLIPYSAYGAFKVVAIHQIPYCDVGLSFLQADQQINHAVLPLRQHIALFPSLLFWCTGHRIFGVSANVDSQ